MLINVSMIGLLLKEQNDAGKLGDDPEQVGFLFPHFILIWFIILVCGTEK